RARAASSRSSDLRRSSWRPIPSSSRSRSRRRSSSRRRQSRRCRRSGAPAPACASSRTCLVRSRLTPSAGRRCANRRGATGVAGATRRSSAPRDRDRRRERGAGGIAGRGAQGDRGRAPRAYRAPRARPVRARRVADAAAPHGLYYSPDPSSQTACTIGGNVAENAGGPHCLKYGVTATHVLGLEVVLADGQVVELGSPGGEPWGPDLVGLFVGSEGNFGIATRIRVRLLPVPRAIRTLLADFNALRTAGEAVSAVIASGIVPAALEMMDQSCINAVEDSVYAAGYPRDAAAVLLVELDGSREEAVAADADTIAGILRAHGARSVLSAADAKQRERLWQGRKKAFGAMGRLSRDLVVQDAVVPRSSLPDVLEAIGRIATSYGLTVSNVFHAGDGNLHPNISFDGRVP